MLVEINLLFRTVHNCNGIEYCVRKLGLVSKNVFLVAGHGFDQENLRRTGFLAVIEDMIMAMVGSDLNHDHLYIDDYSPINAVPFVFGRNGFAGLSR